MEEARVSGSGDELPVPAPRLYRSRSLEEQLAGIAPFDVTKDRAIEDLTDEEWNAFTAALAE